jgi:hypothetical protein
MKAVTRDQRRTTQPDNHPRALFDRMTTAQQDMAFGKGDTAAIRAGADISRVVNERRAGGGYLAGGHEYTREATTVRGVGHRLGDLHTRPGGRYRTSGVDRPTAAQLVNTATDEAELIVQLRRYVYVR